MVFFLVRWCEKDFLVNMIRSSVYEVVFTLNSVRTYGFVGSILLHDLLTSSGLFVLRSGTR